MRVPAPTDCRAQGGASYNAQPREIYYRCGAPYGGEKGALYHEYCHAHQHEVARRAGLGDSVQAFLQTEEGTTFSQALDAYKDFLAKQGQTYSGPGGGTPIEDHAQFCAGWYYGDYPQTANVPFIKDYAAKWLPR